MKLIYETDLTKYQDYILTPNATEIVVSFIAIASFGYMIFKRKNFKKVISANIMLMLLYILSEFIRGDITLKDYLKNKNFFTIEGEIKNYKKVMSARHGTKTFNIDNENFKINIERFYTYNPYYQEYYYTKDEAIKGDGQYIKLEYIKTPNWKICMPFIDICKYSKKKAIILLNYG